MTWVRWLFAALLLLTVSVVLLVRWISDPAIPVEGARHTTDRDGLGVTWYEVEPEGRESRATVVLLPSAGRSVSDFNRLSDDLAAAGLRSVLVQPPGIDGSHWFDYLAEVRMEDLAADVAAAMNAAGVDAQRPAHVVGHAFGNRLARMVATEHGELVASVSLVAAGGKAEMPPAAQRALIRCFSTWRSVDDRLPDIRYAFFADGNPVPDHWKRGWYPLTARLQSSATRATPVDRWWRAGHAPVLLLQAVRDRIAPAANADLLERELGERVRRVDIPDAGHALLPEQPELVARAIIDFVRAVARGQ